MTDEEAMQRLSEDYSRMKILYWQLKNDTTLGNYQKDYEVAMSKLKEKNKRLNELELLVGQLRNEIKELKGKIKEPVITLIEPIEGAEILQVDGNRMGSYVKQDKYLSMLLDRNYWRDMYNETTKIDNNAVK